MVSKINKKNKSNILNSRQRDGFQISASNIKQTKKIYIICYSLTVCIIIWIIIYNLKPNYNKNVNVYVNNLRQKCIAGSEYASSTLNSALTKLILNNPNMYDLGAGVPLQDTYNLVKKSLKLTSDPILLKSLKSNIANLSGLCTSAARLTAGPDAVKLNTGLFLRSIVPFRKHLNIKGSDVIYVADRDDKDRPLGHHDELMTVWKKHEDEIKLKSKQGKYYYFEALDNMFNELVNETFLRHRALDYYSLSISMLLSRYLAALVALPIKPIDFILPAMINQDSKALQSKKEHEPEFKALVNKLSIDPLKLVGTLNKEIYKSILLDPTQKPIFMSTTNIEDNSAQYLDYVIDEFNATHNLMAKNSGRTYTNIPNLGAALGLVIGDPQIEVLSLSFECYMSIIMKLMALYDLLYVNQDVMSAPQYLELQQSLNAYRVILITDILLPGLNYKL